MSDTRTWGGRGVAGALVAATLASLAGCSNAGEQRIVAITGTAPVMGQVFLDLDGDRVLNSAVDAAMGFIRVRLVVTGTRDTVARATSNNNGEFDFGEVPLGQYQVIVPGEVFFADSISVVQVIPEDLDLIPEVQFPVQVVVSYPRLTVRAARQSAIGTKLFVEGTVLNPRAVFTDQTVHVADTSAAIRVTGASGPLVGAGDSVRVLGRLGASEGQATLEGGVFSIISVGAPPQPLRLTTAEAATAGTAGEHDAKLVRVVDVTIADTATVSGDYVATVNDGSGPVPVVFDQNAGLTRSPYVPGVLIDATGVLVPTGVGTWRLKPRQNTDLVVK